MLLIDPINKNTIAHCNKTEWFLNRFVINSLRRQLDLAIKRLPVSE